MLNSELLNSVKIGTDLEISSNTSAVGWGTLKITLTLGNHKSGFTHLNGEVPL